MNYMQNKTYIFIIFYIKYLNEKIFIVWKC